MRSFAGLYFVARVLLFLSNVLARALQISENDPYFMRNIVLAITVLLIVVCRPYKEAYMNKIDTILLIHIGLFCHLVSTEDGFRNERSLAITFEVMIMFPLLCFLIVKSSRLQKNLKIFYQKCKSCIGRRNEEQEDFPSLVNSSDPSVHQVLIEPIALGDNNYNYGAVDYSTY
jgi:hypothetical protein